MNNKIKVSNIILTLIQGLLLVFIMEVSDNKMIPFNFDFWGANANILIYGFTSLGIIVLLIFVKERL